MKTEVTRPKYIFGKNRFCATPYIYMGEGESGYMQNLDMVFVPQRQACWHKDTIPHQRSLVQII